MGCSAKKGKICVNIVPKFANCRGNHPLNAFKCPARQKAQADAWKGKAKKANDKEENNM